MIRCRWALTAMLMVRMPGFGQQSPPVAQKSTDEVIQKLLTRVEALEKEVAELKRAGSATVVAEAASTSPGQGPASNPVPTAAPATPAPAETDQSEASRFSFRGFADIGFLRNADGDSSKRFALGELDLFTTTRITPKLSVLAEGVLETDNQVQFASVPVNLERLLLQYRGNDYFNLDLGSYRTAIGFYSTAYLRGSWLQTALSRPTLFTFEDDGGFLPLHNVGVSANGKFSLGGLDLHYVVEFGSSRNYAQAGRTGLDFEQNGAVNVALYALPRAMPGFQAGFSSYHDRFSPLPGVSMARSVWTAHAVYHGHRIEFLNEGMLARFDQHGSGFGSVPGFYSQLAYRANSRLTPYGRIDYVNFYGRGPVGQYAPQYIHWRTADVGGARFDLSESSALKFELSRQTDRFQAAWIQAAVQLAFTF